MPRTPTWIPSPIVLKVCEFCFMMAACISSFLGALDLEDRWITNSVVQKESSVSGGRRQMIKFGSGTGMGAHYGKRRTLLYKHIPEMGGGVVAATLVDAWQAWTNVSRERMDLAHYFQFEKPLPHLRVLDERESVSTADHQHAFVIAGIRDACDFYASLVDFQVIQGMERSNDTAEETRHYLVQQVNGLGHFHEELRTPRNIGKFSKLIKQDTKDWLRVDCWIRTSEGVSDLRRCVEVFDDQSGVEAVSPHFGLSDVGNRKQLHAANLGGTHEKCSFFFEGPGTEGNEKLVRRHDAYVFDTFPEMSCCTPFVERVEARK
eukprot:TRINITY_DN54326_c0_g1_i1.p1 TRINITY_DN54326_c0_g1~~TRINITY_DN54326_c0_g1_i1.p1  ORF type:complete len:319 (+),score=42.46 TRINITY_DN54326_c0_g1_i1:126-1082(+)